jgi:hypothetical protein
MPRAAVVEDSTAFWWEEKVWWSCHAGKHDRHQLTTRSTFAEGVSFSDGAIETTL